MRGGPRKIALINDRKNSFQPKSGIGQRGANCSSAGLLPELDVPNDAAD
jgi:hypothetical protein